MTTERDTLLNQVAGRLDEAGVRFALVGAAALAVHGVSRSTLDIDLFTSDRRALDPGFWAPLDESVSVDVRVGDAADPLAGVVRCRADGERDVDVVVGKDAWQQGVLARAEPLPYGGRTIPTATVEDLILLKLFAGGSQDRWDIEQLLDRPERQGIVKAVEHRLHDLPPAARRMLQALLAGPLGSPHDT